MRKRVLYFGFAIIALVAFVFVGCDMFGNDGDDDDGDGTISELPLSDKPILDSQTGEQWSATGEEFVLGYYDTQYGIDDNGNNLVEIELSVPSDDKLVSFSESISHSEFSDELTVSDQTVSISNGDPGIKVYGYNESTGGYDNTLYLADVPVDFDGNGTVYYYEFMYADGTVSLTGSFDDGGVVYDYDMDAVEGWNLIEIQVDVSNGNDEKVTYRVTDSVRSGTRWYIDIED